MCRGCKLREALLRRTSARLSAAVDALAAAFEAGAPYAHLRDGGLGQLREIAVDCAFVALEPRRSDTEAQAELSLQHGG